MTYKNNSAFSQQVPMLQLAWDSTSLNELRTCPRKYYYSMILARVPTATSPHLTFGLYIHEALETYDKHKAKDLSHNECVREAVRKALIISKGWESDEPTKTRYTLIRSIVWYLEQFKDDPLQTVILENGEPAVELSFRIEIGEDSATSNEPFLLCGHIDRLVHYQGKTAVVDRKTTKSTISSLYLKQFDMSAQFSQYALAGQVFVQEPARYIIVDCIQTTQEFNRFHRHLSNRPPERLEEFLENTMNWIHLAELFARNDTWPMNESSCDKFGGCPYRDVCSMSPSTRHLAINSLEERTWDPLKVR